jgi:hypothetical protein
MRQIVTLRGVCDADQLFAVLNDSDTDAVKAAFAFYPNKCKAEVEAGNLYLHTC